MIFSIALSLLIVANPIGQAPLFLSLIKGFPLERQRIIMVREIIASFCIAIFFALLGEYFLDLLQVKTYTVGMCGAIVLFMVALGMIFPKHEVGDEELTPSLSEPFIVPMATPLLAGPALLTTIIFYAGQGTSQLTLLSAIVACWVMIGSVLITTPYLRLLLGKSGLTALEQMMGMLLILMSTNMFLNNLGDFLHILQHMQS